MTTRRAMDPEIKAMLDIGRVLDNLPVSAQTRVLDFFVRRLQDGTHPPVVLLATESASGSLPEGVSPWERCVCGRPYDDHDADTGKRIVPPAPGETPCEGYVYRKGSAA